MEQDGPMDPCSQSSSHQTIGEMAQFSLLALCLYSLVFQLILVSPRSDSINGISLASISNYLTQSNENE